MRKSWSPTIVPGDVEQTFYFVLDRYPDAAVFPEATVSGTDLEAVIGNLASGQFRDPLHVVAFNVIEGWSRVVSRDIADELKRRADIAGNELPASVVDFVRRHSRDRQLSLRLA